MTDFEEVATRDELKEGAMMKVKVAGRWILVANVGEVYFAADNRCPHMGGDLSKGTLEGTILTCPLHHSKFDLTDGRMVRWTDWKGIKLSIAKIVKSPRRLTTYAVKVEGEKILVGTSEKMIQVPSPAK
jgi:3-phenylpropionate/trans-cinnamate dioxygenase ferredoxin subunit